MTPQNIAAAERIDRGPRESARRAVRRRQGNDSAHFAAGLCYLRTPYADPPVNRHTAGRMNTVCTHCNALLCIDERTGHSTRTTPIFTKCCNGGKTVLCPLQAPPELLQILSGPENRLFRKNIRSYNAEFAFTSTAVKSVGFELGSGVYTYKVHSTT